MHRKIHFLLTTAFLLWCWIALAGTAAAGNDGNPNNRGALALPVTGEATSGGEGGGTSATFSGQFHLHRFDMRGGELVAVGVLVGTMSSGTAATTIVRGGVMVPVTFAPTASTECQPVHLNLGPVVVTAPTNIVLQLNIMALDFSAEPTAGNPLTSLLCGISARINAGESGTTLVPSLNQLVQIMS